MQTKFGNMNYLIFLKQHSWHFLDNFFQSWVLFGITRPVAFCIRLTFAYKWIKKAHKAKKQTSRTSKDTGRRTVIPRASSSTDSCYQDLCPFFQIFDRVNTEIKLCNKHCLLFFESCLSQFLWNWRIGLNSILQQGMKEIWEVMLFLCLHSCTHVWKEQLRKLLLFI